MKRLTLLAIAALASLALAGPIDPREMELLARGGTTPAAIVAESAERPLTRALTDADRAKLGALGFTREQLDALARKPVAVLVEVKPAGELLSPEFEAKLRVQRRQRELVRARISFLEAYGYRVVCYETQPQNPSDAPGLLPGRAEVAFIPYEESLQAWRPGDEFSVTARADGHHPYYTADGQPTTARRFVALEPVRFQVQWSKPGERFTIKQQR